MMAFDNAGKEDGLEIWRIEVILPKYRTDIVKSYLIQYDETHLRLSMFNIIHISGL